MKVLAKPAEEKKIVAPVKPGATREEVIKSMSVQSQCCVVHLCGCSCDHQAC